MRSIYQQILLRLMLLRHRANVSRHVRIFRLKMGFQKTSPQKRDGRPQSNNPLEAGEIVDGDLEQEQGHNQGEDQEGLGANLSQIEQS